MFVLAIKNQAEMSIDIFLCLTWASWYAQYSILLSRGSRVIQKLSSVYWGEFIYDCPPFSEM